MLTAIRDALADAGGARGGVSLSQKSSQKILSLLGANPGLTIAALCTRLRLSDRAIKNHIVRLKSEGRLRRVGPDKGGRWEVATNGK